MALAGRNPEPGLPHHSGRAVSITCHDSRELLTGYGLVVSMNRKEDCYDNVLMETSEP